jgi:hypothetical protein
MKKLLNLILLFVVVACIAAFCKHTRFGDMYDCYIITDAEVTLYDDGEEYDQIDCEDFMSIIERGKLSHTAFSSHWIVNLYDDEGIRYKLYISRNCRYFRVDSNYFYLSRLQARALLHILGE